MGPLLGKHCGMNSVYSNYIDFNALLRYMDYCDIGTDTAQFYCER
jgi:hypothetical protein